jgi:hypothetical protein
MQRWVCSMFVDGRVSIPVRRGLVFGLFVSGLAWGCKSPQDSGTPVPASTQSQGSSAPAANVAGGVPSSAAARVADTGKAGTSGASAGSQVTAAAGSVPSAGAAPGVQTLAANGGGAGARAPGDDAQSGASATGGAAGAGGIGPTTAGMPTASAAPRFPAVTDFAGPGPYKSVTMQNTGPKGGYSVYRPDMLAPGGAKHPIVGWMSGGSTNPSAYPLLPQLATHGFVVVASNTTPGLGEEVDLGKEIIAGIDWAIAENARQDSPFFEKLDTSKLASMGYSMGSLATFTVANDPRLTTTIHISGGNMETERVKNLHAPAAFFCGIPGDSSCNILSDTCDIAAANCDTDFAAATTPVFYGNFPGGHLGILSAPNQTTIQTEVIAWLHWQLMQDDAIATRFVGDQCTLCKDSHWKKIQQKNL